MPPGRCWPDGTTALGAVDLDVAPGELVVVLGPVGAGKTALLAAIQARDYPVLQGALLVAVLIALLVNLLVDLLYATIDPRVRGA